MIRFGDVITAQKRTGTHKKYVVYFMHHIIKGPYKGRNEPYDFRTTIFKVYGLRNVIFPKDYEVDADGDGWYIFEKIGETPDSAFEHTEAERMGGHTVVVAQKGKHNLYGLDLFRANEKKFKNAMDSCLREYTAFLLHGVGDVQPGSNMLVDNSDAYLIDYEENSHRDIENADFGTIFFKSHRVGTKAFQTFMTSYMHERKGDVLAHLNDFEQKNIHDLEGKKAYDEQRMQTLKKRFN